MLRVRVDIGAVKQVARGSGGPQGSKPREGKASGTEVPRFGP